ncbi:MAG TPA: ABC transporter substrate-binding protein, partial [Ignavibacteriaceae bacterium]|nr:ABC transporter substrate-binding protein [Ignavibacteriaceae bacterium]
QELRLSFPKFKRESKLKRVLKYLFPLIIFSLLFFSCHSDNGKIKSGETEVIFWHSFISSTVPALNELIDKFEKENPGIKIKPQYIPSGDALIQKLITAIQSKTAPDISWLHSDFIEDLVEADAIYKMDHFIGGKDGISKEELNDIYPALLKFSSWKGTLYSLPMEATNLALLYNKDMFKKAGLDPNHPPKNWDELKEFSKKLTIDKNKDGNFEQVGFFVPVFPAAGPLGSWMVWQFMPFLWQAGGDYVNDEQTKVLYSSDAGVKALKLWQQLYEEQNLKTFTNLFENAFVSGNLAMAMDGPWNLPRYNDLLKHLNWGFVPLPAGPNSSATVVGGEYLAIFKQSKNPDAAWKFLKWMIRPEVQAFWSMKSGYLPIRHAVSNVPEFKKYLEEHKNFKVFVDQMEVGRVQKSIDYGGLEVSRNLAEAIERVTVGNMDVKKALDESAEKSNRLLKEAKEKYD